ncbi:MAG: hypothetical protein H7070_06015 [Saprospiraceae bacterium]|nr:hypothetical protein [Pyrinomonadaceae bacterium]
MTEFSPHKPYDLTFEHRPEYLYAFIEGEHDSYKISRQYWQEIAEMCTEYGCKKVLVEEDIAEGISIAEIYRLVSELAEMGFLGIKVAFVDRQLDQAELNDFGVLVGTNRGLNGKAFADQAAAEAWLLS